MAGDRGNVSGRSWGERLRKTLGLGAENPTATIAGPVLPTLEMEPNFIVRPDLAWPSGEILASAIQFIGASAGNHSRMVLSNPANSGYLLTVERIVGVSSAVYCGVFLPGAGLAGYTNANFHYVRDSRVRSFVTPTGNLAAPGEILIRNNNPLGAGDDIVFQWVSLTTGPSVLVDIGWVLAPGQAVGVVATAPGTQLMASIAWRARPLASGAEGR